MKKAEHIIARIGQLLNTHLEKSKAKATPALDQRPAEEIAEALQLKQVFKKGFQTEHEISSFVSTYLTHTNHLQHPHYMGHQVAVPHDLAGIPELIHGTVNNPSSLYEMGPAGATCEGFMINWMLDKVGWFEGDDYYDFHFSPGKASGVLTHGGSVANLTALAAARAAIAPDAWTEGNPSDLVVIGAASAHYSIARALSILGLGKKAFYPVAVNENEVIQIDNLNAVYQKALADGKRVMCVVANACVTSTGLFDPLDIMGDFCLQHKLWFHVDGAHGAAALAGPKSRHYVKGIEKATSIIWDAHKMMRVPALCTAVLFKDFTLQAGAFQQKGSYVFHDTEVVGMDSMPYTIECTKSALGLKLFWAFALEGEAAIGHYIDQTFALAKDFHALLQKEDDFVTPYFPESNILCFRYEKQDASDDFQKELRYAVINQHRFYITSCEMNGKRYLRVVLINPATTLDELKDLVQEIRKIAAGLVC
ncbi:pyridoxal-dependent decarboxylase [Flavobacteriaceae bacterium]|nr:pyridoxal-dependent decarboxylase [Flavobacteriaceae bacterium]MDB9941679.1 pyridoxal-dependent decarboxylase [Flavobacteriaceae bacterium]